jgi:KUP system potassium uptake protein
MASEDGAYSNGSLPTALTAMEQQEETRKHSLSVLSLAALGVVYGDIGTSPLYTIKTIFDSVTGLELNQPNLVGIVSLIFWSLVFVVSLKYVTLILRANNHGEGGVMALLALASASVGGNERLRNVLLAMGVFGAALFYGDSVITPAISVLGAFEGLEVAAPALKPYVVPVSVAVLVVLFLVQRLGTAGIGNIFGPVMVLWFVVLAWSGIDNIVRAPAIIAALNPLAGLEFCLHHGWLAFVALGGVVLALTGAEALYADMGHLGAKPIRIAWFGMVFPALALNYMGQGALLLANPKAIENPFYLLFPSWALYPMVALSTAAAVIASQAVISGAYSITKEAIQLGFLPRLRIIYTSARQMGQIYIPYINWLVCAAVIGAVIGFGSSSALGAANGNAVTGTMTITTCLTFYVVRLGWGYSLSLSVFATAFFFLIDITFLSSNLLKVVQGGWFPLAIGAVIFTVMMTWKRGRTMLFEHSRIDTLPLTSFLDSLFEHPLTRVPGTAIFLSADPQGVPHALLHNLAHNKIMHERVIFLTVVYRGIPWIAQKERLRLEPLGHNCYQITAYYGFKDEVDLPKLLASCESLGLEFEPLQTSYFLSREAVVPTPGGGMALWRERLFAIMARDAGSVAEYFKLPANRVIELGTRIEI